MRSGSWSMVALALVVVHSFDQAGTAADDAGAVPSWIWSTDTSTDGQSVWFRKSFHLAKPLQGRLMLTCDDEYSLFVNGTRVVSGEAGAVWRRADGFDVSAVLRPGNNVLAVHARNGAAQAGLVARLEFQEVTGTVPVVVTDESWRWSPERVAGWRQTAFDDHTWKSAAVIGPIDVTEPWGRISPPESWTKVSPGIATKRNGFEFRSGDRVVWIGGTFVERSQSFGHIETAITASLPKVDIVFRNLGWSGDTVWAESRGIFDPPAKGYERMLEHVRSLRPTVIILNYGANESFTGAAGLERFRSQLLQLHDDLASTDASIWFCTPHRHEYHRLMLPNPARNNGNLAAYSVAVRELASQLGAPCLELFSTLVTETRPPAGNELTNNGLHFTNTGYRQAASVVTSGLGLSDEPPQVRVNFDGKTISGTGIRLDNANWQDGEVTFDAAVARLPVVSSGNPQIALDGADPSRCRVVIDGKPVRTIEITGAPSAIIALVDGPDADQTERLRTTIVHKNELYFHRWRPQNITYLFGFRKHEQGQNAKEVAEFDPLVAAEEVEIARLRKPSRHTWTIASDAAKNP